MAQYISQLFTSFLMARKCMLEEDILCTTGGEISMTLTVELRSWSLKERTNEFRAALEAE